MNDMAMTHDYHYALVRMGEWQGSWHAKYWGWHATGSGVACHLDCVPVLPFPPATVELVGPLRLT